MAIIPYTPDAADADFEAFAGIVMADPGPSPYTAHDQTSNTAQYVYKPIQDELLKLIQVAVAGNAALEIRNETGGTLTKGTLVYAAGYDSAEEKVLVEKADATDEDKLAQFVLEADVADEANGLAWACANLTGIDTSGAVAVGDSVYLNASTPGALAFTAPGSPNYKQHVGVVSVLAASGGVHFLIGAAGGGILQQNASTACEVLNSSAPSIASSTYTELTWDTEGHDADGMHATDAAEIVIPDDGLYDLRAMVEWAANATGRREVRIYKDYGGGGEELLAWNEYIDPSSTRTAQTFAARRVSLSAGDEVSVVVYQDSGGALACCSGGTGANGFFSAASVNGAPVSGSTPAAHAASHTDGSDDIQLASTSDKGLMAAADKAIVDLVAAVDADGKLLVGDTATGKPTALAAPTTEGDVLTAQADGSVAWEAPSANVGPGSFSARLTLESGTAVPEDDQADKSTLYLTPYRGDRISLYSSADAAFTSYTLTEISKALTGLVPNVGYAVWVKASGGVPVMEFEAFKKVVASNSPSAGSSVTINISDTGSLAVGDVVTVKDGSNNEMAQIASLVANTSITVFTLANSYTTPDVYFSNELETALTYVEGVALKTGNTDCRFAGAFIATAADKTQDTAKRRLVANWDNAVPRPLYSLLTGSGSINITSTTMIEISGSNQMQLEYLALGERPSRVSLAASIRTNQGAHTKMGISRARASYLERMSTTGTTSYTWIYVWMLQNVELSERRFGYQKWIGAIGINAGGCIVYKTGYTDGSNPATDKTPACTWISGEVYA